MTFQHTLSSLSPLTVRLLAAFHRHRLAKDNPAHASKLSEMSDLDVCRAYLDGGRRHIEKITADADASRTRIIIADALLAVDSHATPKVWPVKVQHRMGRMV